MMTIAGREHTPEKMVMILSYQLGKRVIVVGRVDLRVFAMRVKKLIPGLQMFLKLKWTEGI
jgi:hypothetical protein